MSKVEIMKIQVDNLTLKETISFIEDSIDRGEKIHHVAVNAFIFVLLSKDHQVKESIINGDLINADGQSIVWASKVLGRPVKERVTGIDLMEALVKSANNYNKKIYLFGARQDVVENLVRIYSAIYSPDIIAGYRNGYYSVEEESGIVEDIRKSGATYLFVAMGSPQKELFLFKYKDTLNLPFIMSVGGSFDVIAGKTKRAPLWMQKSGIEWLFRVIQEPRRLWKRYLITNTAFILLVLKEKLKMLIIRHRVK
jgi:N-acetylglucosaminyldiphosphoundecaprenol N-acetyl-beta-D-mannosaminyltransferase